MIRFKSFLAILAFLLLAAAPALGTSWDVAFYELTEDLSFSGVTRTGERSLAGNAKAGRSPLCPGDDDCYVTAVGRDVIDVTTGAGTFEATIEVKVQGDNPVDAPEFVVLKASVSGILVSADAKLRLIAIPSGTLTITHVFDPTTGQLVVTESDPVPLRGMIRLPFVGPRRRAVYLSDHGDLIPVQSHERSLGLPTARFELNFR